MRERKFVSSSIHTIQCSQRYSVPQANNSAHIYIPCKPCTFNISILILSYSAIATRFVCLAPETRAVFVQRETLDMSQYSVQLCSRGHNVSTTDVIALTSDSTSTDTESVGIDDERDLRAAETMSIART